MIRDYLYEMLDLMLPPPVHAMRAERIAERKRILDQFHELNPKLPESPFHR